VELVAPVFLVFVRIGAVLLSAPFFGHTTVPVRLRILFAVFLAFVLTGYAHPPSAGLSTDATPMLVATVVEAATGLTIGFVAQFLFWSVQFGAEILGFQMGLSLAQVYNPIEGMSSNPIGRFISLALLMVFIMFEGPQQILQALVGSFDAIPLASADLSLTAEQIVRWAGELFSTGVRLASPFIVSFLLVEMSLGIFARVVPQADLFALGLPVKLMVGLGLTYYLMEGLFALFPSLVQGMVDQVTTVIEIMAFI
jgi:flagellar biosynthetic protein FliR